MDLQGPYVVLQEPHLNLQEPYVVLQGPHVDLQGSLIGPGTLCGPSRISDWTRDPMWIFEASDWTRDPMWTFKTIGQETLCAPSMTSVLTRDSMWTFKTIGPGTLYGLPEHMVNFQYWNSTLVHNRDLFLRSPNKDLSKGLK